MKTEEDDEFDYIEKFCKRNEIPMKLDIDPYTTKIKNDTIEEVAKAVEKFRGAFGADTISSFAIYIRGMKK